MAGKLVTIFGGSGFIGRYVVQRLAARGDRVRVAVRRPNEALFLKPLGDVGQVKPVACNIRNADSVAQAVAGADAVINLVGVLHNSGKQTFDALHAVAPGVIAAAAQDAGATTLTHVSAIGASAESAAAYAQTKAQGETALRDGFSQATILRPSLVIGPEDGFFNRFAKLAKMLPILMMPGTETRFQPVCVTDVADAIVRAVDGGKGVAGQTFELGGPQIYTFRQMLKLMMDHIGVHRPIVRMPSGLASLSGMMMGLLPNPQLTLDQVRQLQTDNVVSDGAKTFKHLGITPDPISSLLPKYMVQYRPKGQFSKI